MQRNGIRGDGMPLAVDVEIVALSGWGAPSASVVKRHVNYSKMLHQKTGKSSKLTLLIQPENQKLISIPDLKFTHMKKFFPSSFNYLNFLVYANISKHKIFSFPDPFLYSSLYSLLPSKTSFQVQCHGDFGDKKEVLYIIHSLHKVNKDALVACIGGIIKSHTSSLKERLG